MTLTVIYKTLKEYMDASLSIDGNATRKAQYALGQLEKYAEDEETEDGDGQTDDGEGSV